MAPAEAPVAADPSGRASSPTVLPPPAVIRQLPTYTVQAGDTLKSIARRRGATLQAVLAINPGLDADHLQIGEILQMPAPPAEGL